MSLRETLGRLRTRATEQLDTLLLASTPAPSSRAVSPTPQVDEVGASGWPGPRALQVALAQRSGTFGSLNATIDEFVGCIEIYEVRVPTRFRTVLLIVITV
jgi:hypothetical protein